MRHIALNFDEQAHGPGLGGANIANSGFLDAIKAYSRTFSVTCLSRRPSATQRSTVDLSGYLDKRHPRFDLWLELSMDLRGAIALRSDGRADIPVCAPFHGVPPSAAFAMDQLITLLTCFRSYDTVVCGSAAVARALAGLLAQQAGRFRLQPFAGQIAVIPWGVKTTIFRPRAKTASRRALGVDANKVTLLFMGRITPFSKADLLPLIRCFHRLLAKHPDQLQLMLAGPIVPHYQAALRAYLSYLGIAPHVRFVGPLEPSQRHRAFAAADIYVGLCDTITEGFGLTCIEAMSSGLPAVVSDIGPYRDTVIEGETGYLVSTSWSGGNASERSVLLGQEHLLDITQSIATDVDQLEERLDRLIRQPELRAQIGRAARQRVERSFTWPLVVAAYEVVWRAQLARLKVHRTASFGAMTRCYEPSVTHILSESDRVVASETLNARSMLPIYGNIVQSRWLKRIMSMIQEPRAVRWLSRALTRELEVSEVRRHIMWLVKYGYARILARGAK